MQSSLRIGVPRRTVNTAESFWSFEAPRKPRLFSILKRDNHMEHTPVVPQRLKRHVHVSPHQLVNLPLFHELLCFLYLILFSNFNFGF
jgi:hypothetical protein